MISLRRTIAAIPFVRQARSLLISAAVRSGALRLRRALTNRRHVILTFHHVHAAGTPVDPFDTCPGVSADAFRQILLCVKQRFEVLPLRELCGPRPPARPSAAITFDDGWRDNYDIAFPILRELGLPATVFVTTGKIGGAVPFWQQLLGRRFRDAGDSAQGQTDRGLREALGIGPKVPLTPSLYRDTVVRWKKLAYPDREGRLLRVDCDGRCGVDSRRHFLSAEEILEMAAAGIDFGSHTVTHPILPQHPPADVERELTESKEVLESTLGTPVDMLAYPEGRYSDAVIESARAAGYRIACTTNPGRLSAGDERLCLPRIEPVPPANGFDGPTFAWQLR